MFKIGIIAPEWSLERILSVTRGFDDDIDFLPFVFERFDEVNEILDKNQSTVDGWLLSGPLVFYFAKWHLKSDDKLVYCRITEAGLLRSILQVAYHHKIFLDDISIDFVEEAANIDEMLNEIGIPKNKMVIKQYSVPFDEEELIQFHLRLWKDKAVQCAVTTVPFVYQSLKKAGVPVYSIRATQMEIQLSVELLIEKIKSSYFKNAQLGLQIIEICHYEQVVEGAKTPYKLQLLELKIKHSLLTYCQHINGYLVDKGNGRYEIFGSRGNIENNITILRNAIEKISLDLNIPVIVGIGFGETVFLAQINANKAINHARSKNGIVIIRDQGEIVEPLGEQEELSYSFYSGDEKLNDCLHQANVGVRTYNKMKAIIRQMGWETFSVSNLADQMGVTDRNVRRIVSGLLKAGLIECVGEESSGVSGRPGKVYRFIN